MLKSVLQKCIGFTTRGGISKPTLKLENIRLASIFSVRNTHYLSDNWGLSCRHCYHKRYLLSLDLIPAKGCVTRSNYSTIPAWKMPDKKPFERLPQNVVPDNYAIELQPDLAAFTFQGSMEVSLEVCHWCLFISPTCHRTGSPHYTCSWWVYIVYFDMCVNAFYMYI